MVRGHGKLFHHICGKKISPSLHSKRHATSFYVLIPETPRDTAETNPILRYEKLPEFSKLTPENIIKGGAKLAIEFETKLAAHSEQLSDVHYPKTFESVFKPIEEITVPINYVWRTSKHLSHVTNQDYKSAFQRIDRQIKEAKLERWINEPLFNAVKEIAADRSNLDEYQQRLVDLYLAECRRNGMTFQGKERIKFYNILRKSYRDRDAFKDKVILCSGLFNHQVDDMGIIENLPNSLLYTMAEDPDNYKRGPWKVKLTQPLYNDFMSHCNDRTTRWNVWHANSNICSHIYAGQHLNNNVLINESRAWRNDIAELLGYSNYAELAVQQNMAGSLENVVNLLDTLKNSVMPKAKEELTVIQEFANNKGFSGELKNWDWHYWKKEKSKEISGLNDDAISEYFPLNKVIEGMFNLCNKLFGIHFRENKDCDVWNKDVLVYDIVEEEGSYISTIYIDPYSRPEKTGSFWMQSGAARSDMTGIKQFSYLVLNLMPPSSSTDQSLMTLENVHDLFFVFGDGLQQLLAKAPYTETSGQLSIELDALHACSYFFEKWLKRPEILMSLSCHHTTGQPLTEDLAARLIKGHGLLDGFSLMEDLYKSAFDLEVNVQNWKKGWHTIMGKVYASYMPIPLDSWDYHPNSFTAIFSDQYCGCYYSFVWSQMMAADVFAAFEEQGLSNEEQLAVVGQRFRDTFLSHGGGIPASEVFRRFRGRDPSVEAILEQYK